MKNLKFLFTVTTILLHVSLASAGLEVGDLRQFTVINREGISKTYEVDEKIKGLNINKSRTKIGVDGISSMCKPYLGLLANAVTFQTTLDNVDVSITIPKKSQVWGACGRDESKLTELSIQTIENNKIIVKNSYVATQTEACDKVYEALAALTLDKEKDTFNLSLNNKEGKAGTLSLMTISSPIFNSPETYLFQLNLGKDDSSGIVHIKETNNECSFFTSVDDTTAVRHVISLNENGSLQIQVEENRKSLLPASVLIAE